jgi:hypothetical protein
MVDSLILGNDISVSFDGKSLMLWLSGGYVELGLR